MGRPQSIFVGDKFTNKVGSEAVVTKHISAVGFEIQFLDDFGYKTTATGGVLRSGSFKNPYHPSIFGIGYLGVGDHLIYEEGSKTKLSAAYSCWRSMIDRAARGPEGNLVNYTDCTVCDEWLCFQTFYEWYTSFPVYDFVAQIDKDILVKGNRIYSPEFCTLVPLEINMAFTVKQKYRDNGLPTGVEKTRTGRFRAAVRVKARKTSLGTYDTAEEAGKAYERGKEAQVQALGEEYRDVIEDDAYRAIMSWTAESH